MKNDILFFQAVYFSGYAIKELTPGCIVGNTSHVYFGSNNVQYCTVAANFTTLSSMCIDPEKFEVARRRPVGPQVTVPAYIVLLRGKLLSFSSLLTPIPFHYPPNQLHLFDRTEIMNRLLSVRHVTTVVLRLCSPYRLFSVLAPAPLAPPHASSTAALTSAIRRRRPSTAATDALSAITAQPTFAGKPASEKRYVRITGLAAHASQMDVHHFLHSQNVPFDRVARVFGDVVGNHSVWVYDAGSEQAASVAAKKLAGRIRGTKLMCVKAVRAKHAGVVGGMATYNILVPRLEERGRAVKVSNLTQKCSPRFLWRFLGNYGVVDVRLRKTRGIACIVFESRDEAYRALRERARLSLDEREGLVEMDMLD